MNEFDIQNLIYLSHMIVKDLVHAKLNNLNYNGLIVPEELISILKKIREDRDPPSDRARKEL